FSIVSRPLLKLVDKCFTFCIKVHFQKPLHSFGHVFDHFLYKIFCFHRSSIQHRFNITKPAIRLGYAWCTFFSSIPKTINRQCEFYLSCSEFFEKVTSISSPFFSPSSITYLAFSSYVVTIPEASWRLTAFMQ